MGNVIIKQLASAVSRLRGNLSTPLSPEFVESGERKSWYFMTSEITRTY